MHAWQNLKRRETSDWLEYNISIWSSIFTSSSVVIMSVSACKHKLVCRLQGSLVIYTRHYPEQLHCAYACMIDQEAFVWRMCTPCTNGLGEQHLCKVMYKSIGVQLELDDWFFGVHVCLCASWHTCTLCNRKYSWQHKISAVDCMYTIQWVRQIKLTCYPAGTKWKINI